MCYICGRTEHWAKDCPKCDARNGRSGPPRRGKFQGGGRRRGRGTNLLPVLAWMYKLGSTASSHFTKNFASIYLPAARPMSWFLVGFIIATLFAYSPLPKPVPCSIHCEHGQAVRHYWKKRGSQSPKGCKIQRFSLFLSSLPS